MNALEQNDVESERSKKLAKQLRELREENKDLHHRLEDNERKKHDLQSRLDSLEQDYDQAQSDLRLAFRRIGDLQSLLDDDATDENFQCDADLEADPEADLEAASEADQYGFLEAEKDTTLKDGTFGDPTEYVPFYFGHFLPFSCFLEVSHFGVLLILLLLFCSALSLSLHWIIIYFCSSVICFHTVTKLQKMEMHQLQKALHHQMNKPNRQSII